MTLWKADRNPDKYPAAWHSLLKAPPSRFMLGMGADKKELEILQRKFSAFKATLRSHPAHPTAVEAAKRTTRTELESVGELHALWVQTRWSAALLSEFRID